MSLHGHVILRDTPPLVTVINCHSLACRDTVILTQVRINAVAGKYGEINPGITKSGDWYGTVSIKPNDVSHEDFDVSFYGS